MLNFFQDRLEKYRKETQILKDVSFNVVPS